MFKKLYILLVHLSKLIYCAECVPGVRDMSVNKQEKKS